MCEGGQLPASQMPGQKQHPFFSGECVLIVLQPVVLNDLANVFSGVAREKAEFRKLATQRNVLPAENASAIAQRHFRECQFEIAHADAAKASMKEINNQAESDALCPRQRTGKKANELHPKPKGPIFETLTHCARV